MMDVLLITGFLGAGKTTLIQHLLRSEFNAQEKVAVIVNEVGEIGIDGTLLSGQDVDILELTSGCICCTIKTEFYKAVQKIYDSFNPSYLVVETTGVAQPGDMFDVLFEPPLCEYTRLKSVITVVDADFFEAREVLGTFYDNQIKCADTLILNKIDQVDTHQLNLVKSGLCQLNPEVNIFTAQHCAIDFAALLGVNSKPEHRGSQDHDSHHHEQEGFQSFSFVDQRLMDRDKLTQFLESLPPNLFRCKGWVRFANGSGLLNYTGGRHRIEPGETDRNTALVFVGRNCNQREILSSLKECLT